MNKKLLSVVMALVIIVSGVGSFFAYADEPDTTEPTSETTTEPTTVEDEKAKAEAEKRLRQQQKELQKSLKEAEKKLAELEKNSKVTEEYIDTLDQKIGYINEQLTILETENQSIQAEINKIKPVIRKNEKTLKALSEEVAVAQQELKVLEDKFRSVYEAYCIRLRVMYISGDYNILTALLTCRDVSSFFTRYEMIKSVSKSDTQLLKEVNDKTKEIVTKKDGLDEKLRDYTNLKTKYDEQKAELVKKQKKIESNSEAIAKSKVSLATDRAESDRLLAELTAENQQYTEFRNEDKELIEAVEQEVQDLIAGLKTAEEVTTATRTDGKSTTSSGGNSTKSDVYSRNNAVLNMLYPVPGHYSLSAGFPNYSSGSYHGGIDFPCSTGSTVVAAQDGIVIMVKRLNYSYGYYVMIYHGTDAQGRSVVTLYAHNSSILVSNGESVKRGQTIAKSGSTGNSTGPHCHFEVRLDGVRVNPTNYLSKS